MTEEELDAIVSLTNAANHSNSLLSQKNGKLVPLENAKVLNLIESFVAESQKKLSSFLRKKIIVQFISITACDLGKLHSEENNIIFSTFEIPSLKQKGLIYFDFLFLHTVINLLYGGNIDPNEPTITGLGKAGIKIAGHISGVCLNILQKALEELITTDINLLKTSQQLNLLISQPTPEPCFHLVFQVNFGEISSHLNFIIAEQGLQHLVADQSTEPVETNHSASQDEHFRALLKNELIDSTVTIRACLPEIKLKVKDVMNLKAGDMIPIGDPTIGYIMLNQKKLFKVLAGKSNSIRVLKIIDNI